MAFTDEELEAAYSQGQVGFSDSDLEAAYNQSQAPDVLNQDPSLGLTLSSGALSGLAGLADIPELIGTYGNPLNFASYLSGKIGEGFGAEPTPSPYDNFTGAGGNAARSLFDYLTNTQGSTEIGKDTISHKIGSYIPALIGGGAPLKGLGALGAAKQVGMNLLRSTLGGTGGYIGNETLGPVGELIGGTIGASAPEITKGIAKGAVSLFTNQPTKEEALLQALKVPPNEAKYVADDLATLRDEGVIAKPSTTDLPFQQSAKNIEDQAAVSRSIMTDIVDSAPTKLKTDNIVPTYQELSGLDDLAVKKEAFVKESSKPWLFDKGEEQAYLTQQIGNSRNLKMLPTGGNFSKQTKNFNGTDLKASSSFVTNEPNSTTILLSKASKEGDVIVGKIHIKDGKLNHLAIAPKYQKQGLAKALIKEAESQIEGKISLPKERVQPNAAKALFDVQNEGVAIRGADEQAALRRAFKAETQAAHNIALAKGLQKEFPGIQAEGAAALLEEATVGLSSKNPKVRLASERNLKKYYNLIKNAEWTADDIWQLRQKWDQIPNWGLTTEERVKGKVYQALREKLNEKLLNLVGKNKSALQSEFDNYSKLMTGQKYADKVAGLEREGLTKKPPLGKRIVSALNPSKYKRTQTEPKMNLTQALEKAYGDTLGQSVANLKIGVPKLLPSAIGAAENSKADQENLQQPQEERILKENKESPSSKDDTPKLVLKSSATIPSSVADVPEKLVKAVIKQESRGKRGAVSRKGARGLMQIMPDTAREIAKELGVKNYDIHDEKTNITFGKHYLSKLLNMFDGNVELALAAYNAGPKTVKNWIKLYGEDWRSIRKSLARKNVFSETRNYVTNIMSNLA